MDRTVMHRSTHAKITIHEQGEAEVRQFDVVSDIPARAGQRYSIVSIDISQAIEKIEEAAAQKTADLRIADQTDPPRPA